MNEEVKTDAFGGLGAFHKSCPLRGARERIFGKVIGEEEVLKSLLC